MRIHATSEEAKNVDSIYLDGKRIATAVEADDKEGWVIIALPPDRLPELDSDVNKPKELKVADPIEADEWRMIKLEGDVEIILRNQEGTDDTGLDP